MYFIMKSYSFLLYLCLIILYGYQIPRNLKLNNFFKEFFLICFKLTFTDVSTQPVNDTSALKCVLCNQVVDDIFEGLKNGMGDREISDMIGHRCETFNIFNYKVCNGTASIIMV